MAIADILPDYDKLLDFLVEKATPEEILALRPSDESQQRAEELTERNKAGALTPEEAVELEQMRQLNRLVAMLKAKAALALKSK